MTERLGADRVMVYRLEHLVGDADKLMNLIQKVNPRVNLTVKKLRALGKRDVNCKIQGDCSPEVLWTKWMDEQRKVFKRICGAPPWNTMATRYHRAVDSLEVSENG